jgi:hypothetical protein
MMSNPICDKSIPEQIFSSKEINRLKYPRGSEKYRYALVHPSTFVRGTFLHLRPVARLHAFLVGPNPSNGDLMTARTSSLCFRSFFFGGGRIFLHIFSKYSYNKQKVFIGTRRLAYI